MGGIALDLVYGLLRHGLTFVSAWLIQNGVLQEDQVNQLLLGIAGAIVSVGLLYWKKYSDRKLGNTMLAMPAGSTRDDAIAQVKEGNSASASTPADVAPVLPLLSKPPTLPLMPSVLLAVGLAGLLGLSACAPPTVKTPEGQRAYAAGEVLQRVKALQKATITANGTGALADHTAIEIVKFTVDAADILEEAPADWFPLVRDSYLAVRKRLPDAAITAPTLAAVFQYLDLIFQRGIA